MADWKVSREAIQMFPHPDPTVERLELGKVGQYQIVSQKGLRKNGDIVVFVPDKSILPDIIANEGDMRKYLVGPFKNRVKAIKLKKELSCGLLLDDRPEFSEIPLGQDISQLLGISKYEPPIPAELAGNVKPIGSIDTQGHELSHHDVEIYNINKDELVEGEEVIITTKIHGSQCIALKTVDGRRFISSKGIFKRQLTLEDTETNFYWRAVKEVGLFDLLDKYYPNQHIQAFSEAVPCQSHFTYGQTTPTLFIFRIDLDGHKVPFDQIPEEFKKYWVPVVYRGPFKSSLLKDLRQSKEQISGKELHPNEGIVIETVIPRRDKRDNFELLLKVLNPDYKETGEEIN